MFWNCQEEKAFGFMSRLIISWLYQAQVNVFILRSSKKNFCGIFQQFANIALKSSFTIEQVRLLLLIFNKNILVKTSVQKFSNSS